MVHHWRSDDGCMADFEAHPAPGWTLRVWPADEHYASFHAVVKGPKRWWHGTAGHTTDAMALCERVYGSLTGR